MAPTDGTGEGTADPAPSEESANAGRAEDAVIAIHGISLGAKDRAIVSGSTPGQETFVTRRSEPLSDLQRRAAVGRSIADAYRRIPQAHDQRALDAATRAMITEEPW